MIKSVHIHNFKIHADSTVRFAPLTVLTGTNGSGKSSVTQLLLMLRESVRKGVHGERLDLHGESFKVGSSSGALVNWNIQEDPDVLGVGIEEDNSTADFGYRYSIEDHTYLEAKGEQPESCHLKGFGLFSDNFQYVSAFRSGPDEYQPYDSLNVGRRQVSRVLGRGENTLAILDTYRDMVVADGLCLSDPQTAQTDTTLIGQTNLWLSRMSSKIRVKPEKKGDKVVLTYDYPSGGKPRTVNPFNTGFGISYVLSVIVGVLVTAPGGMVVIENPEAHIHPAAQSALTELLAKAAAAGIQVVVETHSDHIVFGVLVNLKRGVLDRDKLSMTHFDVSDDGKLALKPIEVGDDCRVKRAPRNFVEQMNLDLDVLFDD